METEKYGPNGIRGEPGGKCERKMMMQTLSKPILPFQGAICIVCFLSQGDAIGPGYIGPSARGIALNGHCRIN